MTFYDYKLTQIPNYDTITWGADNVFQHEARLSQLVLFLSPLFKDKTVCIIDHISHAFNVFQQINNSDMDYIILNNSDHPLYFVDHQIFDKPVVQLNYNFNSKYYHPWHLLWSHWLSKHDTVDFTSPRQHLISCLHGKSRIPRVFNMVLLSKKFYFNQIFVNWVDRFTSANDPVIDDGMTASDIEEYFQDFLNIQNRLPKKFDGTEFETCLEIEKGFKDSYLNIVTEARCANFGYLTEKIYKPIRAGQLFLTQSAPGTIAYLRSMGFDTFDDYIDHNHYDNELDWKIRTILMQEVLDNIYPNIEKIFNETVDRRIANANLLNSATIVEKCLETIKSQIK